MSKKKMSNQKKVMIFAAILTAIVTLIIGLGSEDESTVIDETWTPETTQAPVANQSSMVDYIARTTKEEVQTNGVNDVKTQEALDFITKNYPNYYTDNATMEKAMGYGYYLEYGYTNAATDKEKVYCELGQDTVQAVKYVYRGAEAVEDQATQENLKQIKESINKL